MIERAIEEYNKYRKPEAEAKLLEKGGNKIKVLIKVPCRTCGLYDYVEDLIYFLEEKGMKGKVRKVEEKVSIENEFIVLLDINHLLYFPKLLLDISFLFL